MLITPFMQIGDLNEKDGKPASKRPDLKAISKACLKFMAKYNICV